MKCARCGGEKVVLGRFGAWAAFKCRLCLTLTQQYQQQMLQQP